MMAAHKNVLRGERQSWKNPVKARIFRSGPCCGGKDLTLRILFYIIEYGSGRTQDSLLRPVPTRFSGPIFSKKPDFFVFKIMKIEEDRKSTRLNSSHQIISYAVF